MITGIKVWFLKSLSDFRLAEWALRMGLISVFAYAAIDSLLHPLYWVGYLPAILTNHFDSFALLKIFAVYELILAVWLIIGKFLIYCSLICAVTFVFIVVFDFSQILITFRDIGLAFMALALFLSCLKDGNH